MSEVPLYRRTFEPFDAKERERERERESTGTRHSCAAVASRRRRAWCEAKASELRAQIPRGSGATLETTQGQIDDFFSQLPFKCYLPASRRRRAWFSRIEGSESTRVQSLGLKVYKVYG